MMCVGGCNYTGNRESDPGAQSSSYKKNNIYIAIAMINAYVGAKL